MRHNPLQAVEQPVGAPLRFAPERTRCSVILPGSASDRDSVLAFSHHKAGSTMLHGMLKALAEVVGVTFVSIPDELFRRGIDLTTVEVAADLPPTGYCFGGFRFFPDMAMPLLETAKTVLLVRDPRDALVSRYFSARDSHVLPEVDGAVRRRMIARREQAMAMTIDNWVLENCGMTATALAGYLAQRFLSRSNVAVYRYEDVIFRKRAWVEDMLGWFGWAVPADAVSRIVRRFDIFPKTADTSRHIRQVTPGNHRTLLSPATQEKLSANLAQYLTALGYAPQPPTE